MLGVVKLLPVNKLLPPVCAAYQLIVPALAVAAKVTVPVQKRLAGVVLAMVGLAKHVPEAATLTVVAPVDVKLMFPLLLPAMVLLYLIKIVLGATEPDTGVRVKVLA